MLKFRDEWVVGVKISNMLTSKLPHSINFGERISDSKIVDNFDGIGDSYGYLGAGGSNYSLELNNTKSANFAKIADLVREYNDPTISKQDLLSMFHVLEISDYGSQSLSYNMLDFVPYCFFQGLKIPQEKIGMIRSFHEKTAYIILDRTDAIHSNLTDASLIDILISYKRLHGTTSPNIMKPMTYYSNEDVFKLPLTTLLDKISEKHNNQISFYVNGGSKIHNSSLYNRLRIEDDNRQPFNPEEFVSLQKDIHTGKDVDYFMMLTEIISGIDLSEGNIGELDRFYIVLDNIWKRSENSSNIGINVVVEGEKKPFITGTSISSELSRFSSRKEYVVYTLQGNEKYYKLDYTYGTSTPQASSNYEIIPMLNSNATQIIKLTTATDVSDDQVKAILQDGKIFQYNNIQSIDRYNGGLIVANGNICDYIIVKMLIDYNVEITPADKYIMRSINTRSIAIDENDGVHENLRDTILTDVVISNTSYDISNGADDVSQEITYEIFAAYDGNRADVLDVLHDDEIILYKDSGKVSLIPKVSLGNEKTYDSTLFKNLSDDYSRLTTGLTDKYATEEAVENEKKLQITKNNFYRMCMNDRDDLSSILSSNPTVNTIGAKDIIEIELDSDCLFVYMKFSGANMDIDIDGYDEDGNNIHREFKIHVNELYEYIYLPIPYIASDGTETMIKKIVISTPTGNAVTFLQQYAVIY